MSDAVETEKQKADCEEVDAVDPPKITNDTEETDPVRKTVN